MQFKILPVVSWPASSLCEPAHEIGPEFFESKENSDTLKQVVTFVKKALVHLRTESLSAPQVGLKLKLALVSIPEEFRERVDESMKMHGVVLINPVLVETGEGTTESKENCASLQDLEFSIPRHNMVVIETLNIEGELIEIVFRNRLAHLIQHEIDHLNGKNPIDYLGSLKKDLIRRRLAKMQKREGVAIQNMSDFIKENGIEAFKKELETMANEKGLSIPPSLLGSLDDYEKHSPSTKKKDR